MNIGRSALAAGVLLSGAVLAGYAFAQDSVASFYKGKTMRHIVGYPTGATFDTYSRVLVRYMGKYIPGNPNIIVQNMPGAGSLIATRYIANVAPKDGTVIGMPNPVNTVDPLLNPKVSKFDPRKFSWIGSMNTEISTCAFWSGKVKTFDDLRNKEAIVGSTGPSSGSTLDSRLISQVLDLKFKIVTGYPGLAEARLAAQQGELDGHCGLTVSSIKADLWDDYKNGKLVVPLQMGLKKHPALPDVTNAFEKVNGDEERQVLTLIFGPWTYGRPIVGPEGIPSARLAALRTAFEATLKDKEFLAEAARLKLEIQPLSAEDALKTVEAIYQTPTSVVERTRKILGLAR